MCRQIVLVGLAAAILLSGCKLQKEEPVAQQKSVGRILDAALPSGAFVNLTSKLRKVRDLVSGAHYRGLEEHEFRKLVDSLMESGSEGIKHFKLLPVSQVLDKFTKTTRELSQRLGNKIDRLSLPQKKELDRLAEADSVAAAAFLKKHTDIADDKIFARLVESQGNNLDDLAGWVVTNHRLAEAVTVQLEAGGHLKRLGISADQVASELKVSSSEFGIEDIVFANSTKNTTDGYKFLQELSGVDVYDEASVLAMLLHRGEDGKHLYLHFSPEVIKKLGNPFDKVFTMPVIIHNPKFDNYTGYLQEFKGKR